jgi:hypothetical protein
MIIPLQTGMVNWPAETSIGAFCNAALPDRQPPTFDPMASRS